MFLLDSFINDEWNLSSLRNVGIYLSSSGLLEIVSFLYGSSIQAGLVLSPVSILCCEEILLFLYYMYYTIVDVKLITAAACHTYTVL